MARNVVSIKQVVNDFLLTLSEDDYASNVSDYQAHNLALRGCREMGFDMMKRIKSLNLPVIATNATVTLPQDFVDYLRIGYAGTDGLFYTFKENKNLNMSMTYVLDSGGNPIDSNDDGVYDVKDDKAGIENSNTGSIYPYAAFFLGDSQGALYGYGGAHAAAQFRMNYDQNRIEISTNYSLDEITLEYIADDARSDNPCVHIYCEEALRQYMYYKIVEHKSNIPYNEKARARQEYFNEARRAKSRLNSFSKEEALYTIRKNFMQSPKA